MPNQNDLKWIELNKYSLVHHFSNTKESFWEVIDVHENVIGHGSTPDFAIEHSKLMLIYTNR